MLHKFAGAAFLYRLFRLSTEHIQSIGEEPAKELYNDTFENGIYTDYTKLKY